MDAGVPAESIDVNLKLTSLKALHASWLIELYNVLTTADGRETILNGWKKSGVTAVFKTRYCPQRTHSVADKIT